MVDKHRNLAYSTVATAPSPATTGTSLDVAANQGKLFPEPPFNATVWPQGVQPTAANAEVVRVTAITNDTLTIERQQEGFVGRSTSTGSSDLTDLAQFWRTDQWVDYIVTSGGKTGPVVSNTPSELTISFGWSGGGSPAAGLEYNINTPARTIVVGDQIAATVTEKAFSDIEHVLETAHTIGRLTIVGHSYTAGAVQADAGIVNPWQETLVAKLMGMMGVSDENVVHLGQAASAILGFSFAAFPGWRGVAQFVLSNNSAPLAAAGDVIISDPIVASGNGGAVVVHGINDYTFAFESPTEIVANNTQRAIVNRRAAEHAYRYVISRLRAGVIYVMESVATVLTPNATVTRAGAWSNVARVDGNSGAGYMQTTTAGDTFTVTIPENFTGGTVCVAVLGQQNGVSHLTGNYAASGAITVAIAVNARFPTSGTVVIKNITTGEEMLVTAGLGTANWTVTAPNRGVNGTSAAAGSTNDVIVMASDTHNVAWSTNGTEAVSGSNVLGGQGSAVEVGIVKRFRLTSLSAGKTIVGTLNKPVSGDTSAYLRFDSWWIEAPEPPPIVVANIHKFEFAQRAYSTIAHQAAFNAVIDSVIAEFDGWVQLADVYTASTRFSGTLQTTMTTGTTSIDWTADDPSYTPVAGQAMCFGKLPFETVLVTAVSGTGPDWTLTITRAKLGTAAQTHAIGDFLGPLEWLSQTDAIHLNIKGHAAYAEILYRAFQNMPPPIEDSQPAQSQGNWSQTSQNWSMGIIDNYFLYPYSSSLAASGLGLQNTLYAHPIYIPRTCIATEIGVEVVVASGANGIGRFGIYLPDQYHGRPAYLLQEFGTAVMTGTGTQIGPTNTYQILKPGWYWLAVVQQGAASTAQLRTLAGNGMPAGGMMLQATIGNVAPLGYSTAGISGSLPVSFLAGAVVVVTAAALVPRIYLRLRAASF